MIKLDVTNFESCQEFTIKAIDRFKSIDILILNAGVGAHSKFRDIEDVKTIDNVM